MIDAVLIKVFYALVDEEGTAYSIHNRREAIERELAERQKVESASNGGRRYSLCELVPRAQYEQIPLVERDGYPPVTPITDAEPKLIAEGPGGPVECVPTIHARRMEHILDQYLAVHEAWQKAMAEYVTPASWAIEPEEVVRYIARLKALVEEGRRRTAELERET